jgi:hypothetical protein
VSTDPLAGTVDIDADVMVGFPSLEDSWLGRARVFADW